MRPCGAAARGLGWCGSNGSGFPGLMEALVSLLMEALVSLIFLVARKRGLEMDIK